MKPRIHADILKDAAQHLKTDISGPQHHGCLFGQIDDRGFETDPDGASVDDHIDPAVQIMVYMPCPGRTGSSRGVRAWRRDITAALPDQLQRDRVRRHPHGNRVKAACCGGRNGVALVKDHGKRTRPEGIRKLSRRRRDLRHDPVQSFEICDVYDQRIV